MSLLHCPSLIGLALACCFVARLKKIISIYLSIYLSIYVSIYLSIYLFAEEMFSTCARSLAGMSRDLARVLSTCMEYTIGAITYSPGKDNKVVFTT